MRCGRCRLVQFRASHNRCRRCYFPFRVEAPPPPEPEVSTQPDIASGVRSWRRVRGLTQKQLAFAAHLPRTYISRIENGRILPGLPTLERVAVALHVALRTLLEVTRNRNAGSGNGHGSGNGTGDGDGNGNGKRYLDPESSEFLRQMLGYSGQLTPEQRSVVLARVRELATAR